MTYKDYLEKAHNVLHEQYGNDMVRMIKSQEYIHVVVNSLINLDILVKLGESKEQVQPVDYSVQIKEAVEKIVQALKPVEEKPAVKKK